MERLIEFAPRTIDKKTLIDLLTIAFEQVTASIKISRATETDFSYPFVEEIYSIVLDALGVPDGEDNRRGLEELFYSCFLLDSKFKGVDSFYDELIYSIEEYQDVDDALK